MKENNVINQTYQEVCILQTKYETTAQQGACCPFSNISEIIKQ
jgi:hypothetical protein